MFYIGVLLSTTCIVVGVFTAVLALASNKVLITLLGIAFFVIGILIVIDIIKESNHYRA